jgi:hypothetical protein
MFNGNLLGSVTFLAFAASKYPSGIAKAARLFVFCRAAAMTPCAWNGVLFPERYAS